MERENLSVKMLHRFEQGEHRALSGKPIVVDAVRGIKDTAEVNSYIMGYMGPVTAALSEIGITTPQDLGIHESFMHVVVQDPKIEGTTGIEGLSDGMRAIERREKEYQHLGESSLNHYVDGHKIGFAFARANIRKGNFRAIAEEEKIPFDLQKQLHPEIQKWLEGQGLSKIKPEVVLHLHPFAREVFAYVIENGEQDLESFRKDISERVRKNPHYDTDAQERIIKGLTNTVTFAERARESESGKITFVQPLSYTLQQEQQ